MDTKSNSWKVRPWLKFTAVLVALACVVAIYFWILAGGGIQSTFRSEDYRDSGAYSQAIGDISNQISSIVENRMGDRGYIWWNQQWQNFDMRMEQLQQKYDQLIEAGQGNSALVSGELQDTRAAIDALQSEWDEKVTARKANIRKAFVDSADQIKSLCAQHYYFRIKDSDGLIYSNMEALDNQQAQEILRTGGEIYFLLDGGYYWSIGASQPAGGNTYQYSTSSYGYSSNQGDLWVEIAMTPEFFQTSQAAYEIERQEMAVQQYYVIPAFLLLCAALAYLAWAAGRKGAGESVVLTSFDSPYLDLGALATAGVCIFGMLLMRDFGRQYYMQTPPTFALIWALAVMGGASALALWFWVTLWKRIKRREVWRHTLSCKIICWFKKLAQKWREVYNGQPRQIRMILAFVAVGILEIIVLFMLNSFLMLLALIVTAVVLFIHLRNERFGQELLDGAERVRQGDFSQPIPEEGPREVAALAQNINHIAEGFKAAVDGEVRAERMKAELVTNVSHDLKTPLTSIIAYVDLLQKEELHNEKASEYVAVLAQKSARLKVLTEELFEAAKAASGNIEVHLERLDINALLRQGVGELQDKIDRSGLDFRIYYHEAPVWVEADGKLLWRAMENLLVNIVKYALPGSRVYVRTYLEDGNATLEMKNISKYELNIPPEELMERFKRGDASRNTEGSGLGLAIARSLMELQKGRLLLEIDGDLFKAYLVLPQCLEQPEQEQPPQERGQ